MTYREKIYSKYTSIMQPSNTELKEENIKRMCKPYDKYFKGLLPQNLEASILDLGCGSGYMLNYYKTKGYSNIQGVDISQQQIELAQKLCANAVRMDVIDYLQNHRDQYDLIVAIDLVEHLKKEEILILIESCFNALKSGGRLIVQTPNGDSPMSSQVFYGDFTHEVLLSPSLISKLFMHYGFINIRFRETGPVIHGLISFIRFLLWKALRLFIALYNLIERGDPGSGIYTRVFIATALKPSTNNNSA